MVEFLNRRQRKQDCDISDGVDGSSSALGSQRDQSCPDVRPNKSNSDP